MPCTTQLGIFVEVYIHPASALYQRNPEWIVYHELVPTLEVSQWPWGTEAKPRIGSSDSLWIKKLVQLEVLTSKEYLRECSTALCLVINCQKYSKVKCVSSCTYLRCFLITRSLDSPKYPQLQWKDSWIWPVRLKFQHFVQTSFCWPVMDWLSSWDRTAVVARVGSQPLPAGRSYQAVQTDPWATALAAGW